MSTLTNVLYDIEKKFRDARIGAEWGGTKKSLAEAMRDADGLVGCLRRLASQCTAEQIHAAFGAPGDWGYGTPLGDMLAAVYAGKAAVK